MSNVIPSIARIGLDFAAAIKAQIDADSNEVVARHPAQQDTRLLLKQGSIGDDVAVLQSLLNKHGAHPPLVVNHIFESSTDKAVRDFQAKAGLLIDGKVGNATWQALDGKAVIDRYLREQDFSAAADLLAVEVAAIKAVAEVESAGSGFLSDGRVKILFERHKFYQYYAASHGADAARRLAASNANICAPQRGGYKGNQAEYPRLNAAKSYDETAALLSASWGRFQIMGFNFKQCGFASVQEFVTAHQASEGAQLMAFCHFIKHNPTLHKALKAKRWTAFAAAYNGKDYQANKYDSRLASAYASHRS